MCYIYMYTKGIVALSFHENVSRKLLGLKCVMKSLRPVIK